jgi:hypothetical protein
LTGCQELHTKAAGLVNARSLNAINVPRFSLAGKMALPLQLLSIAAAGISL